MTIVGINSLNEVKDPSSWKEAQRFFEELFYRGRNDFNDRRTRSGNSTYMFSPRAIINNIKNIQKEASRGAKGFEFLATRQALSILNPIFGMGQIVNPITTLYGPPPGGGGFFTSKADVPFSTLNPGTRIRTNQDRLKSLYEGNRISVKIQGGIPPVDIQGPDTRFVDGTTIPQKRRLLNLVSTDAKLEENLPLEFETPVNNSTLFRLKNQKIDDFAAVPVSKPDYEALFIKTKVGPAFGTPEGGYHGFLPKPGSRIKPSSGYFRKKKALAHDDAFFTQFDSLNGYIDIELEPPVDDDFYIPFFFSDLRKPERRIYFRAFIDNFTEKFLPEWNKEKYYGRVDPVLTYQSTERIISIQFKIVAMSSVGLSTMWKKINNFTKMMYPTYIDGVLSAAPLIRVRIGDVITNMQGNGLPAIILDSDFNYSESTWDITEYTWPNDNDYEQGKAPMFCTLSLTLQIIHEENPSVDQNYEMNFNSIRRMGSLPNGVPENISEPNDQPDLVFSQEEADDILGN